MKLPIPWRRGTEIKDWERLNERLGDLEFLLEEFFRGIFLGPLPGAYFPISIHRPGAIATGTGFWRLQTLVELRPILFAVGVRAGSGEVTIDFNDDGTSIFASPLTSTGGLVAIRARTAFSTQKIVANSVLSLDVDAISGTPTDLCIFAIFKEVGKIEPT